MGPWFYQSICNAPRPSSPTIYCRRYASVPDNDRERQKSLCQNGETEVPSRSDRHNDTPRDSHKGPDHRHTDDHQAITVFFASVYREYGYARRRCPAIKAECCGLIFLSALLICSK